MHAMATPPVPITEGKFDGLFRYTLEVAALNDITPRTRVVTFASEGLSNMPYEAGQDFMFFVPNGAGTVNRRYTIRRVDRDASTIDFAFFRHASGPAANWVETAKVGDTIEAIGPRGVIFVDRDADWHLFLADDAAVPATMTMIESIAPGVDVTALMLVVDADEIRSVNVDANARVSWHHDQRVLLDALRAVEIPAGRGHVYLNGELHLVREAASIVRELGVDDELVSRKNYWRRDQANAPHGEPAKD